MEHCRKSLQCSHFTMALSWWIPIAQVKRARLRGALAGGWSEPRVCAHPAVLFSRDVWRAAAQVQDPVPSQTLVWGCLSPTVSLDRNQKAVALGRREMSQCEDLSWSQGVLVGKQVWWCVSATQHWANDRLPRAHGQWLSLSPSARVTEI